VTGPLRHLCLWAVVVLFGAFSALAPGTMPERKQGALTMVLLDCGCCDVCRC